MRIRIRHGLHEIVTTSRVCEVHILHSKWRIGIRVLFDLRFGDLHSGIERLVVEGCVGPKFAWTSLGLEKG